MTQSKERPSASRKPAPVRDWRCQECGKRMTMAQADRAMSQGCAKCGGSDIELVETAS